MHNKSESMVGFIYQITNMINGMKYIGLKHYNKGWETYMGSSRHVKQAIEECGIENFKRELVEECRTNEQLREREIYWLKYYDVIHNEAFYNRNIGGVEFTPIKVISQATKDKISKSNTGKKRSEESKQKISDALKGKPKTEEQKEKQSKAMLANPTIPRGSTLEQVYGTEKANTIKANMREARKSRSQKGLSLADQYGEMRALEIRQKLSDGNRGRSFSTEHRQKISLSKIGKPRSAETKAKISATKLLKRLSTLA